MITSPLSPSCTKRLLMFDKVKQLSSKGKTNKRIALDFGIDRHRIGRLVKMSRSQYLASTSFKRSYNHILAPYEERIRQFIYVHPFVTSAEVADHVRKHFPEMSNLSRKTYFNYTLYIRLKYRIAKVDYEHHRIMTQREETPYGYEAQVDFGERRVPVAGSNNKIKIYFFAMVLSRSRYKYTYMSDTPFTAEKAIYAHELAFQFFGGVPEVILYDQDKCFLHREYYGDYSLTYSFKRFVDDIGFRPEFCHKNDPETKGKVENIVKYIKGNFMRVQEFTTIKQYNQEAIDWLNRTGNHLMHSTIKLIPAEEFKKELKELSPYHGSPTAPTIKPLPYTVSKTNVIHHKGNTYSLPWGTYTEPKQQCWVYLQNDQLIIYKNETGKELTRHTLYKGTGKLISKKEHQRPLDKSRFKLEEQILTYTKSDPFVVKLLKNINESNHRYYKNHLKNMISYMNNYPIEVLLQAVTKCMTNDINSVYRVHEVANILMDRAPRTPVMGKIKLLGTGNNKEIEVPEKSKIKSYTKYLNRSCTAQNN